MAQAVQTRQTQVVLVQQEDLDPLLTEAIQEASAIVDNLFKDLDQEVETYAQTANRCSELFQTSTPHKHAMDWSAFQESMEKCKEPWKTVKADEMDGRVRTLTIFNSHREQVKKEMAAELPQVLASCNAAIVELERICDLTKPALLALKKLKCKGLEEGGEFKQKCFTIFKSKIHIEKLKNKFSGLSGQIDETYYALKKLLQETTYPSKGRYTDMAGVALRAVGIPLANYPTVDRLRVGLLEKQPHLLEQNPFRVSMDDEKKEDS